MPGKRIYFAAAIAFLIQTWNLFAYDTDSIQIHGFVSQGFLKSSANNYLTNTEDGSFEFNEFGINFSSQLSDGLHLGMQFFARDLGSLGNDEVVIDWAYADYYYNRFLGIRIGKIKIPNGLFYENRDIDMLRTNILLPQGVYNEGWRDTFKSMKGLGIYGELPLNILGDIYYQGIYGLVSPEPEDGQSKFLNNKLSMEISDYDMDYSACFDAKWSPPIPGLRLGVNSIGLKYKADSTTQEAFLWKLFSVSKYFENVGGGLPGGMDDIPDEETMETLYQIARNGGYDYIGRECTLEATVYNWSLLVEYIWGNLILSAEYTRTYSEMSMWDKTTREIMVEDFDTPGKKMENEMEGYYGSIRYRFCDWYEMEVYYSVYYPDVDDKDGSWNSSITKQAASNNWQKDWALASRFDINSNWLVKLEVHAIDGTAVMYAQDQDDPSDVEEEWFLFAAKMTYNF